MKAGENGFPGFYFYVTILWLILLVSTCSFLLYWWGWLRQPPSPASIPDSTSRGLFAQEGMWQSSNLLVILTFVQVVVGTFTFLFLYKTFTTQRSELRAANRTAQAAENAERPWVFFSVDAQYVHGFKGTKKGPFNKIIVTPVIKNYGKSVATQVWYDIRLLAQDPASNEQIGRGFLPRDRVVALAAGESINIPNLPAFDVGFYFEQNQLSYVVSCTFGYSDTGGNILLESNKIHYAIWATSPVEEFLYTDIAVKEINDHDFAIRRERADVEMKSRHARNIERYKNNQNEP